MDWRSGGGVTRCVCVGGVAQRPECGEEGRSQLEEVFHGRCYHHAAITVCSRETLVLQPRAQGHTQHCQKTSGKKQINESISQSLTSC